MTPACIRILAFAAVAGFPVLAQQPASSPQPQTGTNPQATSPQQPTPGSSQNSTAAPVPSTSNSPESSAQLRPITGQLENKLDTKEAKTGDAVIVKTTEQATTSNGIEIPKGSKIVGRVINVEPMGSGGQNSQVTIQFDQAEIKGGQNLPIRSVIQAVEPPGSNGTDRSLGAASMPSGGTAAGGSPSDPRPSDSSHAGSTASSSAGSTPSAPSPSPSASSGPSSNADAGPSTAKSLPPVGTIVARQGNIAIRTTAIPGIFLAGNANGQPFSNAAGALLGAKKDIHLDGGTTMVVAIMSAPPAMNGR